MINVDQIYGWRGAVRVPIICQAFEKLKHEYKHPAFKEIPFSSANLAAIESSLISAFYSQLKRTPLPLKERT